MAKKMTAERADLILRSVNVFNALERKNTDAIGWIALKFSCTRAAADKMISEALRVKALSRVGI